MNQFDAAVVFMTVVEQGSMTAAANYLDQSASSISKQISYLEKSLKTQLLKRTTRRVEQTEAGRDFYQSIRQIHAHWQHSIEEATTISASASGRLRIAAPQPVSSRFLSRLVADFQRKYPEIIVELIVDYYEEFPCKGADLSICREIKGFDSGSYIGRRLVNFSNQLYAAPNYLKENGIPAKLDDLAEHNCLYYGLQSKAGNWQFLRGREITVSGALRTNSTEVMIQWAVEGWGIARLPQLIILPELQRGDLVPVLAKESGPKVEAWAYYEKLDFPSLKIKLFLAFMRDALKA